MANYLYTHYVGVPFGGGIVSFVQLLLFKTPGYLWYLSALLFAAVPFCLIKNRKLLYVFSMVCYIMGTLFGGIYSEIVGVCSLYDKIFLTTRNGLFFALPLMCVGESVFKYRFKRNYLWALGVSLLLYWGEVLLVEYWLKIPKEADHSMYFSIPLVIFCLLNIVMNWNPRISNYHLLPNCSTSIYVVQYGCIAILGKIYEIIGIPNYISCWILLCSIIIVGCLVGHFSEKVKVLKYLI